MLGWTVTFWGRSYVGEKRCTHREGRAKVLKKENWYAGWDNIVRNLTDPRITTIDVRKLPNNQSFQNQLQNIKRFISDTEIIKVSQPSDHDREEDSKCNDEIRQVMSD